MDLNEILKLFEDKQQEIKKIIMQVNLIVYIEKTGKEQTIIINNLTFEEKKIIINHLNRLYNRNKTTNTNQQKAITNKLKELNLMEV